MAFDHLNEKAEVKVWDREYWEIEEIKA